MRMNLNLENPKLEFLKRNNRTKKLSYINNENK